MSLSIGLPRSFEIKADGEQIKSEALDLDQQHPSGFHLQGVTLDQAQGNSVDLEQDQDQHLHAHMGQSSVEQDRAFSIEEEMLDLDEDLDLEDDLTHERSGPKAEATEKRLNLENALDMDEDLSEELQAEADVQESSYGRSGVPTRPAPPRPSMAQQAERQSDAYRFGNSVKEGELLDARRDAEQQEQAWGLSR